MSHLRGEQFSGHIALWGAANKSKKSVDEVLAGKGGAPWGHFFKELRGCQRIRLPNEMEDGEFLISVLHRKPPHFPRYIHAHLGDFIIQCVKFWHRWVVREDRNPLSMMQALALPGGNCCFCLKSSYLEGFRRAEGGRKGMCELLGEEPPSADTDGPGQCFSAYAEAMALRLCEGEKLHWGCWDKV